MKTINTDIIERKIEEYSIKKQEILWNSVINSINVVDNDIAINFGIYAPSKDVRIKSVSLLNNTNNTSESIAKLLINNEYNDVRQQGLEIIKNNLNEPWADELLIDLLESSIQTLRQQAFQIALESKNNYFKYLIWAVTGEYEDLKLLAISNLSNKPLSNINLKLLTKLSKNKNENIKNAAIDVIKNNKSEKRIIKLSGEICNRDNMCDIISIISQTNWNGELIVNSDISQYVLSFDSNYIINAKSNNYQECIGQILYNFGLINITQLQYIEEYIGCENKLNQKIIDLGFISKEILEFAIKEQIKIVLQKILTTSKGTFAFIEKPKENKSSTKLLANSLLMEIITRVDEMENLSKIIPSSQCVPIKIENKIPPTDLENTFTAIDGIKNIEEIGRITKLGNFEIIKQIGSLIEMNLVSL